MDFISNVATWGHDALQNFKDYFNSNQKSYWPDGSLIGVTSRDSEERLSQLPEDILSIILQLISGKCVIKLLLTNKKFQNLNLSEKFWEMKNTDHIDKICQYKFRKQENKKRISITFESVLTSTSRELFLAFKGSKIKIGLSILNEAKITVKTAELDLLEKKIVIYGQSSWSELSIIAQVFGKFLQPGSRFNLTCEPNKTYDSYYIDEERNLKNKPYYSDEYISENYKTPLCFADFRYIQMPSPNITVEIVERLY